MEFNPELLIPDRSLSIHQGVFSCPGWQSSSAPGSFSYAILSALARDYGFSLDTPFEKLDQSIQDLLIYGKGSRKVLVHYRSQRGEGTYPIQFDGLIKNMMQRYRETASETMKQEYEQYMQISPCETCHGMRLKPESLAVTINDKNIFENN